jgi:hypothetical protein
MFWKRKRTAADFAAELRSHIELEADDLRHEGLGESQAAARARRDAGNLTSIEERFYERHRWLWWDRLRQDVRYGMRSLLHSKSHTVAAILTLALGIGANSAIFSVVNAVLLKPLPYSEPGRIVVMEPLSTRTGKTGANVSAPDFHDYRRQNRSLEFLAYHNGGESTVLVNGSASFAQVQMTTPDFFGVFGLAPAVGRFWTSAEDREPLAVVSDRWARERLGGPQTAIGRSIRVGTRVFQVVGVAEPGFQYPGKTDLWTPAGLVEENRNRTGHNYLAIGRLARGVTVAAAQKDLQSIASRLVEQYPENK